MSQRTVTLSELDHRIDRQVVLAACVPFGEVKSVEVRRQGTATVEFFEADDASDCVDNLEGSELYGKIIKAALTRDKHEEPSKEIFAEEFFQRKRDMFTQGQ